MKLFIVLAVAILLLASCSGSSANECSGKQVSCPSFNDNLSLQWVPYKMNQQLVFNSSSAVNDTFNISDASLSSSYQENVTAGQPFCTATANFKTSETNINIDPNFAVEITLRNNQFNNTQENQVYFRVKGGFFQGAGFSDTGLIKSSDLSLSHFYNTAAIGNKTFSNVQEVYIDTFKMAFKTAQVYKFWIAKNIGVVGYEEYHGKLSVKQ